MEEDKVKSVATLRSPRGASEYKNPSSLEIRKKYEKNTKSPISGLAPKIQKKTTEKSQNWPENDHFCNFSVIFSYFRGQTGNGWFCNFSYFFRISRLEGFLYSVAPQGDRNCNSSIAYRSEMGHTLSDWNLACAGAPAP